MKHLVKLVEKFAKIVKFHEDKFYYFFFFFKESDDHRYQDQGGEFKNVKIREDPKILEKRYSTRTNFTIFFFFLKNLAMNLKIIERKHDSCRIHA